MDQAEFRRLKFLFEPVDSPDKLDEYFRYWLKVQFPWDTVDNDSTGAPLRVLWEIYKIMLTGKGEPNHTVAAARNTSKTLAAAAIHFFSLVQFRRDCSHIAATLNQSGAAAKYLNGFIAGVPDLQGYVHTQNSRKFSLVSLPATDFTSKGTAEIQIVTATKKGSNAPRASCFPGHTLVSTVNKDLEIIQVPIKDIFEKCNEYKVWSAGHYDKRASLRKVMAARRIENKLRIRLTTADEHSVETTPDHQFAVGYDYDMGIVYLKAQELKVGYTLYTLDKISIKRTTISKIEYYEDNEDPFVYDIQVEKHSNFFANGILAHNCLIFDEVDLTPQEILDEARFIGDPTRDEHRFDPVYIYLSSRKTNDGPIQNMMDLSEKKPEEYRLHKWSASDFMEKCPPEVHKPEEGQKTLFIHTENLRRIWGKEEFESQIPPTARTAWKEIAAYEGCKTCPALIPCLGYSAKQRGESPMLRKRSFAASLLGAISNPSAIIAQSLNWKPEVGAIVYRDFTRHKHLRDPISFYEFISGGTKFNPFNLPFDALEDLLENGTDSQIAANTPKKQDIYSAMVKFGWTITNGIDWGFTDPAVSVVVGWHKRWKKACLLHTERATGHANNVWADYVATNINNLYPADIVCPDMADAGCASYFAKHKIPVYSESKKRIEVGVSFVRGLLWNPVSQTINFAILDDSEERGDDGNLVIVEEMEKWSHHKKPTGEFDMSKFADDEWTHGQDSIRYALAPFIEEAMISISVAQAPQEIITRSAIHSGDPEAIKLAHEKSKAQNQLQEHFKNEFGLNNVFVEEKQISDQKSGKNPKKSGGIKFKF